MSTNTPATPPPGWYPDPAGSPSQRWWNGTTWSESTQPTASPYGAAQPYTPMQSHTQPFGSAQPYGSGNQQYSYYGQALQAPMGTNPTTTQAWIIALWPLISLLSLVTYAFTGALGTYSISPYSTTSPADLVNAGISIVSWGAMIFIAYLDYQELLRRQVPKPFHWAFAFIPLPIVYVIGRSVVVYSRTRRGLAPMFVWIGASVATFLASFVIGIVIGIASYSTYSN